MSLREQSRRVAWVSRGACRGLRAGSVSLALACLALTTTARAQPARGEALVAHYSADGDCPSRTDFERRVRARLSSSSPSSRALRFDVRLLRSADGVQATLQVVGQPTSARELSAASCREAADALALVAALMLGDPGAHAPSNEATHGEARVSRRSESRTSGQAARSDPPQASAGPEGSGTDTAISPPTTGSELSSDDAPSAISTALPPRSGDDVPVPPDARAPRQRFFSDWRIRGAIGGLFAWSMAPQLRAGPSISAGASARPRTGGPRFNLELGARGAYPHEIRIPEGKATFRWVAFTSSLCVEGPEHRFSVAGCALLETGWTDARSKDGVTPRERTRFWGALGPALVASALFHPKFGVRLSGELLGVLVRDRFFLADRLLYSVPRLAFRAGLSLYYSLW